MTRLLAWLGCLLWGVVATAAPISDLIVQATGEDEGVAETAVVALRRQGPAALDELFRVRDQAANPPGSPAAKRLDAVIDRVGGQRYCSASRLFWYSDWEQAREAAQAAGKPVLSLRMLGNLTDEFSCANSRFFRTTLYSNAEISQHLRENFVLHWKSVRPVPRVSIDFGDGRKLERTLTGNSIHYVLLPSGEVIDGLPGLYSPDEFLKWLKLTGGIAKNILQAPSTVTAEQIADFLKQHHLSRLARLEVELRRELDQMEASERARLAATQVSAAQTAGGGPKPDNAPPRAEKAAEVAVPKSRIELPILRNITARFVQLEQKTNDDTWAKLAASRNVQLDEASLALIRGQNPTVGTAMRVARTKALVEDPLARLVTNLRSSIAIDTVRNEYLLHRRLHEWLGDKAPAGGVEQLNERVYAELFLTPSSDPWLGLVPANTYTALENNGVAP